MKLVFAFCLLLVGVGVLGQANVAEQRKPFTFLDKGDSTKLKLVSVKGDTLDLCPIYHKTPKKETRIGTTGWPLNQPKKPKYLPKKSDWIRFIVKKDNKYALCNTQGILQTDYVYDSIYCFERANIALVANGLIPEPYALDNRTHVFLQLEVVASTLASVYNPLNNQHINAILVRKNGKQGLIDSVGNELVPAVYSDIWKTAKSDSVEVNAWGVRFANSNVWVKLSPKYKQRPWQASASRYLGNQDRFIVARNGKVGFVNRFDDEVIEAKYQHVWDFYNGYAAVRQNNKIGLIDLNGKVVVPIIYNGVTYFDKGVALAMPDDYKTIFIDTTGQQIATDFFDVVIDNRKNPSSPFYFKRIYEPQNLLDDMSSVNEFHFSDNLIHVAKYDTIKANNYPVELKYGYMNSKGHLVIDFLFSETTPFKYGLAIVKFEGFYGIIDTTGNWIIDPIYSKLESFNQFSWFKGTKIHNENVVLHKAGQRLEATSYQMVHNLDKWPYINSTDTYAYFVVEQDKHFGVVDTNNRVLIPVIYDKYELTHLGYVFWKEGKASFWNLKFEKLDVGTYDTLSVYLKVYTNSYVAIKKNGKWGFVNFTATNTMPVCVYDSIYQPIGERYKHLIAVKKGEYFGYCDNNGKEIFAPIYKLAPKLTNNLAIMLVKDNKVLTMDETNKSLNTILCYLPKNVFIVEQKHTDTGIKYCNLQDKKGNVLSKNYDAMQWYGDAKTTFIVAQNGKLCGLLNLKGQEITPLKYTRISSFNDGLAIVDSAGLKGLVDKNGKVVCKTLYRELYYDTQAALFRAWTDSSNFWIDKMGKEYSITEYGYTRIKLTANSILVLHKLFGISLVDNNNKVLKSMVDYSHFVQLVPKPYFIASKNGYFGVIDSLLRVVVPFVYSSMKYAGNGLLIVSKNNRFGCINLQNEVLVPLVYEELGNVLLSYRDNYDVVISANNRVMAAKLGGYYGAVDMHNKIIVPFEYDDVIIEKGHLGASVQEQIKVIKNHRYGYFDLNGKLVEPCVRYYVSEW